MDIRHWVYTRIGDTLPTGKQEWRGLLALLRDEPNPDVPYMALDDGSGTVEWIELATADSIHDPVTVADTASIDMTLTGQQVSAAAIFGTSATTVAQGNHTHANDHVPVTVADTDSIDLTLSGQQVSAAAIFGSSATTIAAGNHTHANPGIIVQEGDSTVDAAATTLDFIASDFVVTSSPAGEANVALAFDHVDAAFTRLFFDDTGGSTSSTTIYTSVISETFTLPPGTWTVEANAWGRLGNDAGSSVDIRMTIDGTTGTVYTRTGSTVANPGGAASSKAGVASGSTTVSMAIKSDTTGLSTMTNVHMIVNAYRTA
jgi:hypothetical protein